MSEHLMTFAGKSSDAESTLMPEVRSWLRDVAVEVSTSADDHCVILFCVCPALGILSASKTSFLLNFISNVLADFKHNSVCVLVKPNRAGQQDGRLGLQLFFRVFDECKLLRCC